MGKQMRVADTEGRKALTYFSYFRPAEPARPAYLKLDFALHRQIKQMSRFRLSCHKLAVETGRHAHVAWQDRICTRCTEVHRASLSCAVDDEHHMIFDCQKFEHLRHEVVEFVPGNDRHFTPGVRTLITRARGCVRTFMNGDPRIVLRFIARCMDILDAESESIN